MKPLVLIVALGLAVVGGSALTVSPPSPAAVDAAPSATSVTASVEPEPVAAMASCGADCDWCSCTFPNQSQCSADHPILGKCTCTCLRKKKPKPKPVDPASGT